MPFAQPRPNCTHDDDPLGHALIVELSLHLKLSLKDTHTSCIVQIYIYILLFFWRTGSAFLSSTPFPSFLWFIDVFALLVKQKVTQGGLPLV